MLQYCDTGTNPEVSQLLLKQHRSFKINLERSTRFPEKAMTMADQTTTMEQNLFSTLNIPLEFNFQNKITIFPIKFAV